jgi:Domain of unknown function (DUF4193)
MATDYDKPRTTDNDEVLEQSVEALKATKADAGSSLGDDTDAVEIGLDLPDADLSAEELTVRVLPRQADEFTCTSCYLVHHRSQLAAGKKNQTVCVDCAA